MKQHLSRKRPCQPILSDTCLQVLLARLVENERRKLATTEKTVAAERSYVCEHCQKVFRTPQGKYQHKRAFCKNMKQEDVHDTLQTMHTAVDLLRQEVQQLREETKVVGGGINNCNNNIQVNVINGFGREDTSHLTTQFLDRCVKKTNAGLIDLLDKLHFGADHGCNANVRITNRKLPLAEVNNGTQWHFCKKDTVIHEMVDRGQDILQEHLDEHQERIKEQISESMWEHIHEYFERMEVKDAATIQNILDDVYIMLLNKTRELMRP
jgi:hypothetical protein